MPYKDPDKQRKYQRDRGARIRAFYVELSGGKCGVCGSNHRLEFHHVDPKSKITHRLWSYTKHKIELELAKCELLCSSCHDDKTYPHRHDHGTKAMYARRGCRCETCRRWRAEQHQKAKRRLKT